MSIDPNLVRARQLASLIDESNFYNHFVEAKGAYEEYLKVYPNDWSISLELAELADATFKRLLNSRENGRIYYDKDRDVNAFLYNDYISTANACRKKYLNLAYMNAPEDRKQPIQKMLNDSIETHTLMKPTNTSITKLILIIIGIYLLFFVLKGGCTACYLY